MERIGNRRWLKASALGAAALLALFILRPPQLWLNLMKAVEPTASVGAQLAENYGCRECHRIAGAGALKAPKLDGLIPRQQESDPVLVTMRLWLRNPAAVKGSTAMPDFHLSESEIDAILLYLATLTE